MPITIKGIRLRNLSFDLNETEESNKITGTYELISSLEKVLATQSLGGYSGMKVPLSPTTSKAFYAFLDAYRADVQTLLGLETTT